MVKYLKAEAEIIKFDNSDVVTSSVCQDNTSVEDNCANGGNYETQSANCRGLIWRIVQAIIATINNICASNGWWFPSQQDSVDEFSAGLENPADF